MQISLQRRASLKAAIVSRDDRDPSRRTEIRFCSADKSNDSRSVFAAPPPSWSLRLLDIIGVRDIGGSASAAAAFWAAFDSSALVSCLRS